MPKFLLSFFFTSISQRNRETVTDFEKGVRVSHEKKQTFFLVADYANEISEIFPSSQVLGEKKWLDKKERNYFPEKRDKSTQGRKSFFFCLEGKHILSRESLKQQRKSKFLPEKFFGKWYSFCIQVYLSKNKETRHLRATQPKFEYDKETDIRSTKILVKWSGFLTIKSL